MPLIKYCLSLPSTCFNLHAEEKTSWMKWEGGAYTYTVHVNFLHKIESSKPWKTRPRLITSHGTSNNRAKVQRHHQTHYSIKTPKCTHVINIKFYTRFIKIFWYGSVTSFLLLRSLISTNSWWRSSKPSVGWQDLYEGRLRSSASSSDEDELEKSEVELLLWRVAESEPDQAVPLHLRVESSSSSSGLDSSPPIPNSKWFFTTHLHMHILGHTSKCKTRQRAP